MYHLEFDEISARNFQSYKEFNLPIKPGKHLLTGENGAGKSTIFDTLCYAAYKYNLREKNPSHNQKGNCVTSFKFRRSENRYQIDRYLNDLNHGNKAKIFQNDEDLTARKHISTEEEVIRALGISEEVFTSLIVVSQGIPINFTQLSPTIRKSLIEDYLGFSAWDQFRPRFTAHLKNLNMARFPLADAHIQILKRKNQLHQKLEVLRSVNAAHEEVVQKQVLELKNIIRRLDTSIEDTTRLRTSFGSESLKELTDSYNRFTESYVQLQNRSRLLEKTIINKICGECEQPYPTDRITAALAELEQITKKKNGVNLFMESASKVLQEVKDLEFQMRDAQKNREYHFNQLTYLINENQSQKNDNVDLVTSELASVTSEEIQLTEKLIKLDESIDHVKYLDSLLLPSSQFRTKVLENYLGYINSILNSVCPLIFDGIEVKLIIEEKYHGIDFEIIKNGIKRTYAGLSGGEQRRLDLTCILSFQKFIIESSGLSSNLLVFDEVFDHIDSKGLDRILSSLDTFFPDSSSIYVVSHNNNLKSRFSSVINVWKENDVSSLDLSQYH